jgi:nucleotide-binding universal stress UspA family protein
VDLRNRGARVDALVCRGPAANEILRVTREIAADLIIMGTHGRTGIRRLVVGSVAEAVVRGAGVPVLVQKPGAASSAPECASTQPGERAYPGRS